MNVGIIGLGRMGAGIGARLIKAGFTVVGYDPSVEAQKEAEKEGIKPAATLAQCVQQSSVLWLLIPAGSLVDTIIAQIKAVIVPGTIIIDAGNSKFTDSVRRSKELAQHNIAFIDCGTSGGVHGKKDGYSLMIGGEKEVYETLVSLFKAIAAPQGYGYVGPSGAGHFVKMVHNGIEYGLLQAYGEGFHVVREGPYNNLDLVEITRIWSHGAVIRSWLLEQAHDIFKHDQQLKDIKGDIAESGTGAWTVETAHELNIPVPVIEKSLEVRAWSRKTGGNFATKTIALLRHAFGGHAFGKKS